MNLSEYKGIVKIIDTDGYIWKGRVYGLTPKLDTNDELYDEIDIDIMETNKGKRFKGMTICFNELEIANIEEIDS